MKIFRESSNQMAYLKMGIFGRAGAGKSFTASRVAIGLATRLKMKKPVAYFDTETGSDFLIPMFKNAGIHLVHTKSKAFSDLPPAIDEAEKEASVMIADSITHPWNELINSYLKKYDKKRLTLRDWQPLKQMWHEFSERFINSKLHFIWCARSSDLWEETEDPEDGAKELKKTGTKPKTEGELGYEPSLLVEMESIQVSPKIGSHNIHRAYIRKDRFDVIDGKAFDDPDINAFWPHIELLNLGGEHKAVEPGRDSQAVFEDNNLGERKFIKREILLEKIGNEIKKLYPGQTENDKTSRIALFEEVFGTNSWTEISRLLPQEKLQKGLDLLIHGQGWDELPENKKQSKPKAKGGKK